MSTFLARSPDKTKLWAMACVTPSGLMLNSWKKIDGYGLDSNLGVGKPEAVRRPCFIPFESVII